MLADGKPVPGATVYAGRMIFGNGTSNAAQFGPMGQGTKQTTTDADGAFALSGFGDGDVTIVAEHPDIGRSKALRLPADMPGQTELTLELAKFGALSGVLRQGGKPAEGVFVSCQSTTTPGALYSVASGPDGAYRFDKLAPDIYKVSATLGMPMMGMQFYSKQIEVPSGKEVTIDLAVEPGAVTLDVTARATNGTFGVGNAWLASGVIAAQDRDRSVAADGRGGPGRVAVDHHPQRRARGVQGDRARRVHRVRRAVPRRGQGQGGDGLHGTPRRQAAGVLQAAHGRGGPRPRRMRTSWSSSRRSCPTHRHPAGAAAAVRGPSTSRRRSGPWRPRRPCASRPSRR